MERANLRTVEIIDMLGNTAEETEIEFFFYSMEFDNAADLANELKMLEYQVVIDNSASKTKGLLINGWTNKMKIDDDSIMKWTEKMTKLALKCDVEFDGWGTLIHVD